MAHFYFGADNLESYCAQTGRKFSSVASNWNYFIAFSLFRMAAIAQGIAHRAELGVASNNKAQEAGALVEPFCSLGWEIASARGAGING